jgi:glycosyltransferase involved in cell wall biosynthesis
VGRVTLNLKNNVSLPDLSIIVPVYNEEEVLPELHRRLTASMLALGLSYEILLVDDGSRDRSLEIMRELAALDPSHVRPFSFSRNFGHHIALTAGLDHATGQTIVMMDADLQDQPEELYKMLAKLNSGFDVVYADRQERQHSWYKTLSSRMFIGFINSVAKTEVPINSSIYRVMTKEVADKLRACRERARFLPGLVSWLGYRQTSEPVEHGKRFAGTTKYSLWRLIRLALNTSTSFSSLPLQVATLVGLVTAVISLAFLGYIIVRKFLYGFAVMGYASLMFAIMFFGALQLIVLGLMGEYIGRIYSESQARPLYLLKDLTREIEPFV